MTKRKNTYIHTHLNQTHNTQNYVNDANLIEMNSIASNINCDSVQIDGSKKLDNIDFIEISTEKNCNGNNEINQHNKQNNEIEIRKQYKQNSSKLYCYYCRYKIREMDHTKLKYVMFNSKKKLICRFCTSKEHKTLKTKFKDYETQCLICNSKTNPVKHKNCLACSVCKRFVHANCCKLSKTDVNKIEKSDELYICMCCSQDAFPHFEDDELKPEPKLKNKQLQCFKLNNKIDKTKYKNKKAEYKDDLTIYFCRTCSRNIDKTGLEILSNSNEQCNGHA